MQRRSSNIYEREASNRNEGIVEGKDVSRESICEWDPGEELRSRGCEQIENVDGWEGIALQLFAAQSFQVKEKHSC